ncbi:UNVERIFIED_CONTAM: hypothetical protein FKN15_064254 [Acipenser sinensis]
MSGADPWEVAPTPLVLEAETAGNLPLLVETETAVRVSDSCDKVLRLPAEGAVVRGLDTADSKPGPRGLPTRVSQSVHLPVLKNNNENRRQKKKGDARPIVRRPLKAPVLDRQRNSLDSNSQLAGYRAHPALTWSAFTGCATREPLLIGN